LRGTTAGFMELGFGFGWGSSFINEANRRGPLDQSLPPAPIFLF
jgi:hypothetical protein